MTDYFTNIGTADGTLEVTKNNDKITFTTASAEKVYDGTPLLETSVTVDGLPDGLSYVSSGGGYTVTSYAGTYTNKFSPISYTFEDEDGNMMAGWRSAAIYDADGNDVTDNFTNIDFVEGTLTIHKLKIRLDFGNLAEPYNGTTHAGKFTFLYLNGEKEGQSPDADGYEWTSTSGKCDLTLYTGDKSTVKWSRVGPDARTEPYTIKVLSTTFTNSDSQNMAENYEVEVTGTSLTITPVEITVTTGSAEKVYDVKPLTNSEATITTPANMSDISYLELPDVTATGTITNYKDGGTVNTYSIDWGSLNSSNYKVTSKYGTLKIEKLKLNIKMYWKDMGDSFLPWTECVKFGNGEKEGIKLGDTEAQQMIGDASPDKEYIVFVIDSTPYIIKVDSDDKSVSKYSEVSDEYTTKCTWSFNPDISHSCEVTVDAETRTIGGPVTEPTGGYVPLKDTAPENKEVSESPKADTAVEKQEEEDKSKPSDADDKADTTDEPDRDDKTDTTDEPDSNDKADTTDEPDRDDKPDSNDKAGESESSEKPDKADIDDKSDGPDSGDKSDSSGADDKSDRSEDLEKSVKADSDTDDKAGKSGEDDKTDKSDADDKTRKSGDVDKYNKSDTDGKAGKSGEEDKGDKSDADNKAGKSGEDDKGDKSDTDDKTGKSGETD